MLKFHPSNFLRPISDELDVDSIDVDLLDFARSDYGEWRDRADWSSRVSPTWNEHIQLPIRFRVPIIQDNPTLGDCNDERDNVDWSSRMSFIQIS